MNITRKDEKLALTFQIEIVETLSNIVEVIAEDKQSALLKAQEMYRNEQVVLYPDDFIDTKFVVLQ
ncbi:DpnD/PcfM family protein [Psychrobacter pacificensis]|uniref:DpnD/PcfM family protein n=1 Tax=Psychrobacter pacificensis TaxID=112002 RepID=UPI0023A44D0A|nr:DpnD/PcfM family protein [Psychrobacter pacificensis]MDE0843201.1 DpnD/PcfM family protein [Psychrobacter pacificensis]MEC9444787.1 DpnD/PcfM family protein [Pseudomonadota bacterium]MED6318175.1 DpnD/PcfM family protein [Pseudomonadota bacterium]